MEWSNLFESALYRVLFWTYGLPGEVAEICLICESTDGVICVGTSSGLYNNKSNSSKVSPVFPSLITKNSLSILIDQKNDLIVDSLNGLTVISHSTELNRTTQIF